MYHILLETDWWELPNASSIVWICPAVHEILADKAFTATDGLVSQSFVVAFVHPAYVQIALIWGFPAQLSLWNPVYWLWRYKLNEVCDKHFKALSHNRDVYRERVEPMLVLLSDSYSKEKISVCNSRLFSYPAYTFYLLLLSNYCSNKFYTILSQERYSTLRNVLKTTAVPLHKQITRGPVAQGCYEKRVANMSI